MGRRGGYAGFWWGDLREKTHLEELGADNTCKIILKWIFKKWNGGAWTGLIWLRKRTAVGFL
jgi:hypothetical protein